MKSKLLGAAFLVASLSVAGNAQALHVAGWDFSQFFGDGAWSIDGVDFSNGPFGANYSSLDPSGLGPDSGAFGRFYIDGQFGSTAQGAGSGLETILPSGAAPGSLVSNITAPVTDGFLNEFDSLTSLAFEGQVFTELLALTALGAGSVVFQATPTLPGTDWLVTFGARTQLGSATFTIDFSTDGQDYAEVAQIPINTVDTAFSVPLGQILSQQGFVRFNFNGEGGAPLVDNVAIFATLVPEPGTALLLLAGLAGLATQGRRRA